MFGFNEFIYKHIIPACFMAPMKPTFDLTDAQTVQVYLMLWKEMQIICLFLVSPNLCRSFSAITSLPSLQTFKRALKMEL